MPEAAAALLGIDFGQRTVGVALGHPLTGSARPLEPVRYRSDEGLMQQLGEVIARWRPGRIIVGLPLAGDGTETEMSRRVRAFGDQLKQRHPDIGLDFQDERLSSHAAAERHAGRRKQGRARRSDARQLDSVAASVILESWMREHP